MHVSLCRPLDEIFTHDDEDGVVRDFNASAMVRFAMRPDSGIEIITVPCGLDHAQYIRTHRGIEQPRLDRLCEPFLSLPIVFVEWMDGSHLSVDGHHRWVRRAELGLPTIDGYRFPLGLWEHFLVTGTRQDWAVHLSKMQVLKRMLLP